MEEHKNKLHLDQIQIIVNKKSVKNWLYAMLINKGNVNLIQMQKQLQC